MQLDFNAILATESALIAPPMTLVLDNVSYALRPLTLLDGASIDAVRVPLAGELANAHNARICATLAALFAGPPLPFLVNPAPADPIALSQYRGQMLALLATVGSIVKEYLSPKAIIAAAMATATDQIEAGGMATASTVGAGS